MSRTSRVSGGQLIFGLAVLATGLILTLDRLHYVHAWDYLRFWPLALLAIGLVRLAGPHRSDRVMGVVFLGLGAWFMGWLPTWPLEYFWPIVMMVAGLALIRGGLRRRAHSASSEPGAWIHAFAFWTALKRKSQAAGFRGGDLSAVMGGIELDLTGARIDGDQAVLQLFCMWGGIELKVPREWRLDIQLLPLLGGYADNTQQEPSLDSPILVIKGSALMAGVDIKN